MRKVAIIHPWFPQYRKAFFEQLITAGRDSGVQFDIYHGDPPPEWGDRGDAARTRGDNALPTRFFTLKGKSLVSKNIGPLRKNGPYDLTVLEQAVRNLETYRLLAVRWSGPLAFWGHGRTYTQPSTAAQETVKQWVTSKGIWFFAYTDGGARAVVDAGFSPDRVTVVRNSIDTSALSSSIEEVSSERRDDFKVRHRLTEKVGLFIGGLDQPKRIPFLLDAARIMHQADPDFRLLVAGQGEEQHYVEKIADAEGWLSYAGRLFGPDKATAMAVSSVLMMPGRVGLVAVDSFAAGLPIATTNWPWHAPEFEYLIPEHHALITPDNVNEYAAATLALITDPAKLSKMRANCLAASADYSIEAMVKRFVTGVQGALAVAGPA